MSSDKSLCTHAARRSAQCFCAFFSRVAHALSLNIAAAQLSRTASGKLTLGYVIEKYSSAPGLGPQIVQASEEIQSGFTTGSEKCPAPRLCFKCHQPGHIAKYCRSKVDINAMDYASMKEHFRKELEEEAKAKETPVTQEKGQC